MTWHDRLTRAMESKTFTLDDKWAVTGWGSCLVGEFRRHQGLPALGWGPFGNRRTLDLPENMRHAFLGNAFCHAVVNENIADARALYEKLYGPLPTTAEVLTGHVVQPTTGGQ